MADLTKKTINILIERKLDGSNETITPYRTKEQTYQAAATALEQHGYAVEENDELYIDEAIDDYNHNHAYGETIEVTSLTINW